MKKPKILFVAGLNAMPDGGTGGQVTASTTLFQSAIGEHVEMIPLSSTMRSLPPPPLAVRAIDAARRVLTFDRQVRSVDAALIFCADGFSVIEKSVMCRIARRAGVGVLVRPSSGFIPKQCETSKLVHASMRAMLRNAHIVFSQGGIWNEFYGGFPESQGKLVEMQNGIVVPPVAVPPREYGAAPHIVFVGWVVRPKGVFDLLPIITEVRKRFPGAKLTLAGGGDLEMFAESAKAAGAADAVELRGWVPHQQMAELLSSADLFVLPSRAEGMPNAMLEAMAIGLPVAATPVGAIPKVLRDGENGFLLELGNPPAMARKIIEILSKPEAARRAGRAARETILAEYDIERVWPVYLQAIRRSIAESERGRQINPEVVFGEGYASVSAVAPSGVVKDERQSKELAKGQ